MEKKLFDFIVEKKYFQTIPTIWYLNTKNNSKFSL